MRGKAQEIRSLDFWDRITPAYAGKSDSWDIDFLCDLGSPPPMRGKVVS